jgi:hypothetical protein
MESTDGYIEPLEKAYVYASKTLLELLVGEKDLIGHLRSVKHYFLMDQVQNQFNTLLGTEENYKYIKLTKSLFALNITNNFLSHLEFTPSFLKTMFSSN